VSKFRSGSLWPCLVAAKGAAVVSHNASRQTVRDLVDGVVALDDIEAEQRTWILAWIDEGQPLFRVTPPVDPPQHLAVYFALFDDAERSLMLVDHKKANAWLLAGGHVDPDEDPRWTVVREAEEELRLAAKFHDVTGDAPLFLSITTTRGLHSHVDVTLWFVLKASRLERFEPDPGEFNATHWFPLAETDWTADHFDPHMARFVAKLRARLA
jgi:8-oxo-dGTP diphosphatase